MPWATSWPKKRKSRVASLGADMDRDLAALGQDLGDDTFAIHLELAETAASLPMEHRLALANAVLASASPAVRDAALGWLLDRNLNCGLR